MDLTTDILSRRERAFLVGDHASYRSQLSKSLASLRKKLGRATGKNQKFTVKPITIQDFEKDHEFALIYVLSAERAWAHASQMKTSNAQDSASQGFPGSTRSHIVSRLTKAAGHAEALVTLLKQANIHEQYLEAQAYAAYLNGSAEFEKHSASSSRDEKIWKDCLQNMSVARVIYAVLQKKNKKDAFKEMLSSSVEPAIRFAAYQSEIPRTVPVSTIAIQYFPNADKNLVAAIEKIDSSAFEEESTVPGADGAYPTSITWRSRKAKIVDASIGQALLAVFSAEERLIQTLKSVKDELSFNTRATLYDDVLTASQDVINATRHAIEEHENEKIPESDSRMQDLRVTNLSVNYDMISWRIGRNRLLIGARDGLDINSEKSEIRNNQKLAKIRERVVLLDGILQSVDSIKELQGAARDNSLMAELEAKREYFQALRCANIAHSHSILSNNSNTLALLLKAHSLLLKAQKLPSLTSTKAIDAGPLKFDVYINTIKSAEYVIQQRIYQYQGLVEMQRLTESAPGAKAGQGKPLQVIDRLNEYSPKNIDLFKIINYPPTLQPVPVEPLFLDSAFKYIQYPGQSEKITKESKDTVSEPEEDKKPAKRGWFGFGR